MPLQKHRAGALLAVVAVLLAALAFIALPAAADTIADHLETGGFSLHWFTVDGGGASGLSGGAYTLSATAGQPDAGRTSNQGYALAGGFWASQGAIGLSPRVYIPIVSR